MGEVRNQPVSLYILGAALSSLLYLPGRPPSCGFALTGDVISNEQETATEWLIAHIRCRLLYCPRLVDLHFVRLILICSSL